MGVFRVDGEIINPRRPKRRVEVSALLVDSGSESTWLPEKVLRRAGVAVSKKDVRFLMANGEIVSRSVGYAIVRASGFETVDEVVFGQPGDLPLLGARTLEGFGAVVDARRKRLVAAGPHVTARSARAA